ncbi:MAG: hypothetical protein AB7E27_00455 [Candidatus Methanomethylophilaceae archaeon]
MAAVLVRMRVCDKTHEIEVTQREDGLLDVHIESDCIKVQEYGRDMGPLSMDDLGCITQSRIMDPLLVEHLTPTCMAPVAVFNAAWLEAGMISRSFALKAGENTLEFLNDNVRRKGVQS